MIGLYLLLRVTALAKSEICSIKQSCALPLRNYGRLSNSVLVSAHQTSKNSNRSLQCSIGEKLYKQQFHSSSLSRKSSTLRVQDEHLLEHQTEGVNMQGTLRILLLLHATQKDTVNVLKLIKTAKSDGVMPSWETMINILGIYTKNKYVDSAVDIYSSIQEEYPSHTIDSCNVIDLSTLLVEKGRNEEGFRILKEYLKPKFKRTSNIKKTRKSCRELLAAAAATGNYELTQQLFDLLTGSGLAEPDPYLVVPLLQCKLDSGDLQGVVQVEEYIYKTYNLLPKRMEILIRLLHWSKKQSLIIPNLTKNCSMEHHFAGSDLVERMLSLIIQSEGFVQAQHELLFACLETGQPEEAREKLQNIGEEVNNTLLDKMCKLYSKNEREEELLHLLYASRGNHAVHRTKIFNALLNLYIQQNSGDKGLTLWTMAEEEKISLSEIFCAKLASLLDANGINVPF